MFGLVKFILGVGVIAALLAVTPMAVKFQKQEPVTHLLVNTDMMAWLEQIAEEDSLEEVRCVQGSYVAPDTIKLEAAFETPWLLRARSDTGAMFRWDLCPSGTIAWWHSHPWKVVRKLAREQNISPQLYCDLSDVDQIGRRLPFAIISVRRGLSCFFWQKSDGTYARIPLERDST